MEHKDILDKNVDTVVDEINPIRTGDLFFCRSYTVMGMISSHIGGWEWHIGIICNVLVNGKRIKHVLDASANGIADFKPLSKYLNHPLIIEVGIRKLKCSTDEYWKIEKSLQKAISAIKGKPFERSISTILRIGSNILITKQREGLVCTEMIHKFLTGLGIVNVEDIPELSPPGVYIGDNDIINSLYHDIELIETGKHDKELIYKLMMKDAEKSLGILLLEKIEESNKDS